MTNDISELVAELAEEAEEAAAVDDAAAKATAEKSVVDKAKTAIEESDQIDETDMSMLSSSLSSELDHYNKTDLKNEFEPALESEPGEPFDTLLESRLQSIKIIKTTDHKQGSLYRWEFADGVEIETKTTDDGQRMHYSWQDFRDTYFDALAAQGDGIEIGPPEDDLSDPECWKNWIEQLILDHSEHQTHVGPRTEAVMQLRDYIERSPAYTDMADVRDCGGVGIAVDTQQDIDTVSTETELYIPQHQITAICDQSGISTRALQIELDSRAVTSETRAGVSDSTYINGSRWPYWAVTLQLGEPVEIIDDPVSPADQVANEQQQRMQENQTDVGAVDDKATDGGNTDSTADDNTTAGATDGENGPNTDSTADDNTTAGATDGDGPGLTDEFGADPDGGDQHE